MKATAMFDGLKWHDLFKDPITDVCKKSLRGRVTTYMDREGNYFAERLEFADFNSSATDIMEIVYLNGKITKEYSFEEIIQRE